MSHQTWEAAGTRLQCCGEWGRQFRGGENPSKWPPDLLTFWWSSHRRRPHSHCFVLDLTLIEPQSWCSSLWTSLCLWSCQICSASWPYEIVIVLRIWSSSVFPMTKRNMFKRFHQKSANAPADGRDGAIMDQGRSPASILLFHLEDPLSLLPSGID